MLSLQVSFPGRVIPIHFEQAEMGWVFSVLEDIEADDPWFEDGLAGVFERGRFVGFDHFGLDVVVDLKDEHTASKNGKSNFFTGQIFEKTFFFNANFADLANCADVFENKFAKFAPSALRFLVLSGRENRTTFLHFTTPGGGWAIQFRGVDLDFGAKFTLRGENQNVSKRDHLLGAKNPICV
jgi:hypothetical protein